ncbi:type II toxin-antitoxin system RelE/ParE family toxin [Caulobacter sp.]|uniref:type II toxin-antitoxin system RelE/ParE family toxin n=1 Tax=Caulobacter sp. TaxID=78 RepID=UPI002B45E9AD|nr:type II toxin-antitoxin system RelE/ParE family toxin [Caulobacter sp.]HJV41458.1 type II toxin-antitoxin system RelE/ParE family toxin [Caulobacter sp.]
MKSYRLSVLARLDLIEIWNYSRDQWGERRAEAYLRSIQTTIETVANNPHAGGRDDALRKGYRRRAVQSHVIFYRAERGVEIVRVLHQSMDAKSHLG